MWLAGSVTKAGRMRGVASQVAAIGVIDRHNISEKSIHRKKVAFIGNTMAVCSKMLLTMLLAGWLPSPSSLQNHPIWPYSTYICGVVSN